MSAETNTFPHRDINTQEANTLRAMWGGNPLDRHAVGEFIELGGKPLLTNNWQLMSFLGNSMVQISARLDLDRKEAQPAYSAGALIYAGVYEQLTGSDRLPVHNKAIAKLGALEEIDFIMLSCSNVQSQAQRFCELFQQVIPLLTRDPKLAEVGLIGAGAIHSLILQSEEIAVTPSILDEEHPELADLFKDFPPASA